MGIGKGSTKNKFTHSDDIKLKQLIKILGKNWIKVSEEMHDKNPRQCRDRYEKYLSPEINHEPFSAEEDIALLDLYQKIGPKWVKMAKIIKGRSDVALKSRFKLLQRHGKINQEIIKAELDDKKPSNEPSVSTRDCINEITHNFQQLDNDCLFNLVFEYFD